jgi:cell division protein FtsI (penicillin-binding protein 3)
MNKNIENLALHQRKNKVTFLFILLIIAIAIFLSSVLKAILSERHIPSQFAIRNDRSLRGDIISADNYTLSRSQKTYQAVIRGASIDPEKKEIFILAEVHHIQSIYRFLTKNSFCALTHKRSWKKVKNL